MLCEPDGDTVPFLSFLSVFSYYLCPPQLAGEGEGMSQDAYEPTRLESEGPDEAVLERPDAAIPEQKIEPAYLRGRKEKRYIPPLPISQFDRACVLPGKSLAVYLLLWRQTRIEKRREVKLTSTSLRGHGISRHQKETALSHLERAGLIVVKRCGRRNPEVTLLDLPDSPAETGPTCGGLL